MASRAVVEHMEMWVDEPCRTFFAQPLRPSRIVTARPPIAVKEPRRPALDTVEAHIKIAMRNLRLDDDAQMICGVKVRPTKTLRYMAYIVNNEKGKLSLADAVSRVIEIASEREGGGV